jgi:hypothetical protein
MKRRIALALLASAVACRRDPARETSPTPAPDRRSRIVDSGYVRTTAYWTGDANLDALQDRFPPTLEANRRELGGQTGPVRGFGAGTIYPQIWLRDSATLIPATRYFFPPEYLTSWLEEHLSHQRANGELWDWIAAGDPKFFANDAPRAEAVYRAGEAVLSADKNTSEADQESSAVLAAAQVVELTGDRRWLEKKILGRTVLARLDAALEYVVAERMSPRHGLVMSAFTADWGDVSPTYGDQRVIYRDDQTPVVVGLYTNALFVGAALSLARMHESLGEEPRAGYWKAKAAAVKSSLDGKLWQEKRGFYRLHLAVPGPARAPAFDDSNLFALGGNALAALYGIAGPARSARIFAIAEERQKRYGISTIAGVLLPPYPSGFFKHPILRDEYTYQNGGQWDWFAGRFLLAEFEQGRAGAAHRQLLEIAERVARAGGLYEWNTREGSGRGSPQYAGSAGALAAAVFQGLFGIDSRADGLDLTVRTGVTPALVRVYEPAIDRYVVYAYDPERGGNALRLRFESNAPGRGRLGVLVPVSPRSQDVLLDGGAVPFDVVAVGTDTYVSLETDWKPHVLDVKMP